MTLALTSPVTGGPQTGLTSPTYTIILGSAPDNNGVRYVVTALGGTQVGVSIAGASTPFDVTLVRPRNIAQLGVINPINGLVSNVANNVWYVTTRKSVVPLSGQQPIVAVIQTRISAPAGSDAADAPNLRAMLSLHFGACWQASLGVGDSVITGI